MTYEKSCGAIIVKKDQVFLVKQRKAGDYNFPKGHVEQGETEEETAYREVKEETNLSISILSQYRYDMSFQKDQTTKKEVVYFLASLLDDHDAKRLERELLEMRWVDLDQVSDLIVYPELREVWSQALHDIHQIIQTDPSVFGSISSKLS